MAKKLTDDMLKWTLEIDGKPAQKALGGLEQKTRGLEKANKALSVEMQKMEANGKKNTKEFRDLEKQYRENNKTIRQSKAKMKELREEIGLTGLTSTQLKKKMRDLTLQMDRMTPNTPEWNRLNNELSVTAKRFKQVKAGGKKVNGVFGNLKQLIPTLGFAAVAAGIYQGFKRIISGSIDTRAEFSKYEAMLENSLGSQKLANEEFEKLQQFAADTPFQLNELTNSYVKLSNYGLKPGMEDMRKYGDVAASLGKSFDQYVEAIADATQFEFERLKEFGIRAKKEGDKVKFTFKGITTEVDAEAKAVQKYLASLGDMAGVAGGMEKISQRIGGALSNSADASDKLANSFGKRLEPTMVKLIRWWTGLKNSVADYISISPSEKLRGEQRELNLLTTSLINVGDNQKIRNKLLQELQTKYPDFLKNMDTEKLTNEQLRDRLIEVNAEYVKRIRLAAMSEMLQENERKSIEAQKKQYEVFMKMPARYQAMFDQVAKGEITYDKMRETILATTSAFSKFGTTVSGQDRVAETRAVTDMVTKYENLSKVIESATEESKQLMKMQSTINITDAPKGDGGKVPDAPKLDKFIGLPDEEQVAKIQAYFRKMGKGAAQNYREALEKEMALQDKARVFVGEEEEEAEFDPESSYAIQQFMQTEEFKMALLEMQRENELISEKEYQDRKTELDRKGADKRYKQNMAYAQKARQMAQFGANFVNALMQMELEAAGDNEEKKKKIRKKYAVMQFMTSASGIIVNTAGAIMKALEQLGPVAGPIAAGIVGATGAVQLGTAYAQMQKVKGLESGGYANVRRAQDNKEFRAKLDPRRRGFIDKTSLLVSEAGGEFVANAGAVQNPSVRPILDVIDAAQKSGEISTLNLPSVLASMGFASPGLQSGGYSQPAQNETPDTNDSESYNYPEAYAAIEELNRKLDKGIRAYVIYGDIEEKADEVETVRNNANL